MGVWRCDVMSKIIIDQKLCDQVRFMYAGGANTEQIANMTGASATTVRRIRRFEFSAEKYAEMNENRRKAEAKANETREEQAEELKDEQVPGQISMEQIAMSMTAEAPKPAEQAQGIDEAKLMRFLAGKFDEVIKKMEVMTNAITHQMERQEMTVFQRVDKINDNLCQVLRKMDGG